MPENDLLLRVVALLAAILLVMVLILRAKLKNARDIVAVRSINGSAVGVGLTAENGSPAANAIPQSDPLIDQMTLEMYRRAFGSANFNYAILGEHQAVMNLVRQAIPKATTRRDYFPRKPLLIPRLLAAIKNSNSSMKDLVDIILEDPVLTGDVLKTANSPLYRLSKDPIETIGRAVSLLGLEGLRALVATSVMQPVFVVPPGYFENFSEIVWKQAVVSALAAQGYATITRKCDGFSAHLLAMLYHLTYIVLFRLIIDQYKQASGSLPRAEVFTRLMDENADDLARRIAEDWQLADSLQSALGEFRSEAMVNTFSPLAHSLYLGRICAAASLLCEEGVVEERSVLELLQRKGLDETQASKLWSLCSPQRPEKA